MQKLVFTNGGGQSIDLTSGNFGITNWEGLSNTELNIQTQQVPFQDGGVFLDALMEQREISVTVATQDNNDLSLRYELKRQLISALNPKLGEGVLVYTNDYLSRQIKAVPQLPIFENKNSNDAGTLKASVVFSCPSPYWEDTEETSVTFKQAKTIVNNGDVPTQLEIAIPTGASNVMIGNKRNQKQITLNGSYEDEVVINTNVGQKSIKGKNMGFTWVNGGSFLAVTYGNGKYIYAGFQVVVEDIFKQTKLSVDKGGDENINGLVYSETLDLFVGAGGGGNIFISSDGTNWTRKYIGGGIWESVTYNKNLFIAVNADGKIITSTDGINWTEQTSGVNVRLRKITYSETLGLFIVVGDSGTILTSPDGINWTSRTSGVSTNLVGVVYSELYGIFVTVGHSGTILTSLDGINWTSRTSGVASNLITITYGNNLFVTSGVGGTILTSPDGINWTSQTSGIGSITLWDIIFVNNNFIVVGNSGTILTSIDGITWTKKESGIQTAFYGLTYGNNLFVAVGNSGVIATSENGKTWESQNSGISQAFNYVIYINGLYIAVADGGKIVTSENATIWTERDSGVSADLYGITYSETLGLFVIAGTSGVILTSDNGINWTSRTSGTSENLYGVVYSEILNIFVIVGTNGVILRSQDGISWVLDTNGFNLGLSSITYGNGIFVAVGQGILTSLDGITWAKRRSSTYNKIFYNNNLFIAVSTNILASSEGINWFSIPSQHINVAKFASAYGLDMFVLVGNAGLVLNSYIAEEKNLISNLSKDSDMTFNLEKGENEILFLSENNSNCTLTYRQKYIGV